MSFELETFILLRISNVFTMWISHICISFNWTQFNLHLFVFSFHLLWMVNVPEANLNFQLKLIILKYANQLNIRYWNSIVIWIKLSWSVWIHSITCWWKLIVITAPVRSVLITKIQNLCNNTFWFVILYNLSHTRPSECLPNKCEICIFSIFLLKRLKVICESVVSNPNCNVYKIFALIYNYYYIYCELCFIYKCLESWSICRFSL